MSHLIKRELRIAFGHAPMLICMLLLAFSIFGWGLHSKLSLYTKGMDAQPVTPIAKLLSEQERPSIQLQTAHQEPPVPEPATPRVIALYAASLCPPPPADSIRTRHAVPPVEPLAFSFDGPASLRPPPISAA